MHLDHPEWRNLSFLRHPRLAQAVEEPFIVSYPFRIVGQGQLLLSKFSDGLGGDAIKRKIALERFPTFHLTPRQCERRRKHEVGEIGEALRPLKPVYCLIILALRE